MKRIPLTKIILELLNGHVSGIQVVKFIQNNYRRRVYKPYMNKEAKAHRKFIQEQANKIFSGKSMLDIINERNEK